MFEDLEIIPCQAFSERFAQVGTTACQKVKSKNGEDMRAKQWLEKRQWLFKGIKVMSKEL